MVKRMLIDATHSEETRVVVVNGTRLEELDVESSNKKQLKGNIYLAKVIRVEPSLQAAFVDYGGNRHGFLAFSEIHPDYYQIPVSDREKLIEEERAAAAANGDGDDDDDADVATIGGDDTTEDVPKAKSRSHRTQQYKIQEVIKRRQILLVQVVKEERGNKGAALTTYLSLAGRYCVLMPNTARGGGVSRKISSVSDRKRLKGIMSELDISGAMALIVRTAGAERSKAEIKRDYEYLVRTWDQIRELTLESSAPALIYEEANLIKRSIRDLYARDIDEILVEGDEGYRLAKDFMKQLTPSHAKKVQPYKDEAMPLFHRYQVESQLDAMHSPTVQCKSGGYIVMNQTEALVAIDVNSGRATKERHIEETALKTNLEAADEIARQLRLRDMAGLVVIDFIDMEENKNNAAVERRLREALKNDRARIQVGRISHFGLLELSRQRLRPSLMETSFEPCPHCHGTGHIRSVESTAIHILRVLEEEGVRRRSSEVTITVPTAIALYILNHKRAALAEIETRYGFEIIVQGSDDLVQPSYEMERVKAAPGTLPALNVTPIEDLDEPEETPARADSEEEGDDRPRRRRRRRRRRPGSDNGDTGGESAVSASEEDSDGEDSGEEENAEDTRSTEDGEDRPRRRRRGRRGGRKRRRNRGEGEGEGEGGMTDGQSSGEEGDEDSGAQDAAPADAEAPELAAEPAAEVTEGEEKPKRRRVSRKKADETPETTEAEGEEKPKRRRVSRKKADEAGDAETGEAEAEEKPKRRRTTRKKAEDAPSEETAEGEEKPKRRRTTRKKAEDAPAADSAETAPEPAPEPVEAPANTDTATETAAEATPEPAAEPTPVVTEADLAEPPKQKKRGWWSR